MASPELVSQSFSLKINLPFSNFHSEDTASRPEFSDKNLGDNVFLFLTISSEKNVVSSCDVFRYNVFRHCVTFPEKNSPKGPIDCHMISY